MLFFFSFLQRDEEDMIELVRDCQPEFKEYYIQMQTAKRSQAPLPSQVTLTACHLFFGVMWRDKKIPGSHSCQSPLYIVDSYGAWNLGIFFENFSISVGFICWYLSFYKVLVS